ncbi:MAG TPA: bifunctional 4-hydroxy-2-oxoglutarate aldolase/2-dehydro-3-deoxy-phosphogluconate aldolase [Micromonosporaceae bacterium]|nr:bifunctional 4-hydroxy-2-oxoglutarate aldolase/2-dehydro-3-deoxy-phosphogluconate aldolase [Micromonosporaceae bacterium]
MSPLDEVTATIEATRLVPVVVIDDAAAAEALGSALAKGGLRCAEVTFRTPAAEDALRAMARNPEMFVGAGTVLTPDQVDRAVAAGAKFIVSPGFSPTVVRHCQQIGVPVFPGVATATEIQAALEEGLGVVKFFPAEPLGGLPMIKALAAPFPALRFIPTGGITAAQLGDYLGHRSVLAVGGSWMVAPKLIAAADWPEITRLTAEAVAVATKSPAA